MKKILFTLFFLFLPVLTFTQDATAAVSEHVGPAYANPNPCSNIFMTSECRTKMFLESTTALVLKIFVLFLLILPIFLINRGNGTKWILKRALILFSVCICALILFGSYSK